MVIGARVLKEHGDLLSGRQAAAIVPRIRTSLPAMIAAIFATIWSSIIPPTLRSEVRIS